MELSHTADCQDSLTNVFILQQNTLFEITIPVKQRYINKTEHRPGCVTLRSGWLAPASSASSQHPWLSAAPSAVS